MSISALPIAASLGLSLQELMNENLKVISELSSFRNSVLALGGDPVMAVVNFGDGPIYVDTHGLPTETLADAGLWSGAIDFLLSVGHKLPQDVLMSVEVHHAVTKATNLMVAAEALMDAIVEAMPKPMTLAA